MYVGGLKASGGEKVASGQKDVADAFFSFFSRQVLDVCSVAQSGDSRTDVFTSSCAGGRQ